MGEGGGGSDDPTHPVVLSLWGDDTWCWWQVADFGLSTNTGMNQSCQKSHGIRDGTLCYMVRVCLVVSQQATCVR